MVSAVQANLQTNCPVCDSTVLSQQVWTTCINGKPTESANQQFHCGRKLYIHEGRKSVVVAEKERCRKDPLRMKDEEDFARLAPIVCDFITGRPCSQKVKRCLLNMAAGYREDA